MKRFSRNSQNDFRLSAQIYFAVILFLCLLMLPSLTLARREPAKRQPKAVASQVKKKSAWNSSTATELRPRRRSSDFINKQSSEDVTLLFTLDWTNCQVHRMNDDQPLEIVLDGTIESNSPEIWTLFPIQPKPEITPDLHYVAGVSDEMAIEQGRKTLLEWTISVDKGMPEPMTILPDNSLTYTFPAGRHIFQVRITGKLERDQPSGYYQLRLAQLFAPQL